MFSYLQYITIREIMKLIYPLYAAFAPADPQVPKKCACPTDKRTSTLTLSPPDSDFSCVRVGANLSTNISLLRFSATKNQAVSEPLVPPTRPETEDKR